MTRPLDVFYYVERLHTNFDMAGELFRSIGMTMVAIANEGEL